MLDVDGRDTAGTGGGDGLAVGRVDDVAGGEDTLDAGLRGPALDGDGALRGEIQLALDQVSAGIVADRDEDAGHGQLGLGAVQQVLHPESGDLVATEDILDAVFQTKLIFSWPGRGRP